MFRKLFHLQVHKNLYFIISKKIFYSRKILLFKMFTSSQTICVSFLGYISYIAANFSPSWYTLIPTALFLGFCAAPLWSSQSQYITVLANRNGENISTYFGIFYCIYQGNQLFGNLISTFVFQDGFPSFSNINQSGNTESCGINYCTRGGTECGVGCSPRKYIKV